MHTHISIFQLGYYKAVSWKPFIISNSKEGHAADEANHGWSQRKGTACWWKPLPALKGCRASPGARHLPSCLGHNETGSVAA